jgi:cubilin
MGFRLEWYNEGCGGKLMKPEGTLTSPNYPDRYTHKLTCIWEIEVDFGFNINVTIHDLDLERERHCVFDYLLLAHDPAFNDTVAKICSVIHSPLVFTSDGHKLYIKFEADESQSGKGFNMSYEAVIAGNVILRLAK